MIPSTLEVLEKGTFFGCRRLSSVTFAEGSRLREIGPNCFALTALKTFEAPPNLKKIFRGAFFSCGKLQYVVLNEGLEALGEDDEPDKMKMRDMRDLLINKSTFEESGLKEIVLPGTLVKLSENSFQQCRSLKRVWVEQRCQIRVKDYLQPGVDVQIFRAEDGNPLDRTKNSK